MSTNFGTEFTEQNILNKAKDQTYETLDVTPYIETSAGVSQRLGYLAPLPAAITAPVMTTVEDGALSVTNAGTAQIGTVPSVAYELTVCNASDTDMYWSWKTSASATNGIFLAKSGGAVSFTCPASKSPYFYCASTKDLNWTTRTL